MKKTSLTAMSALLLSSAIIPVAAAAAENETAVTALQEVVLELADGSNVQIDYNTYLNAKTAELDWAVNGTVKATVSSGGVAYDLNDFIYAKTAADQDLSATLTLLEENFVAAELENVTKVEMDIDGNLVPKEETPDEGVKSVTAIKDITVEVGTEVVLPATVEVVFEAKEGEEATKGQKAVTWDLEGVDFTVAGTTTLVGEVADTELTATIKVVVMPEDSLKNAVTNVKTKADADTLALNDLKAPILNIQNIKDANLTAYKTAIKNAFVVDSVEVIQSLVDGVNTELGEAAEALEAAQLAAIKEANTVAKLKVAFGMGANEEGFRVFNHIVDTTADLNAYRLAAANAADLDAVQTAIDNTNIAKVEAAVAKAEASNKQVDVTAATAALTSITTSVHTTFEDDVIAEGEETYTQRIAAVQAIVTAATELQEAINAVVAVDDTAYKAVLETLKTKVDAAEGADTWTATIGVDLTHGAAYKAKIDAITANPVTWEDIHAAVVAGNTAVTEGVVAGLVDDVNAESITDEALQAALKALQDADHIENVVEDYNGPFNTKYAALNTAKEKDFADVAEIQTFVNNANAAVVADALKAVNNFDKVEGTATDFKAKIVALETVVKALDDTFAMNHDSTSSTDDAYLAAFKASTGNFADAAAVKAFVVEVNAVQTVVTAAEDGVADVASAIIALNNAEFINLRPSDVRTDVATLVKEYITATEEGELVNEVNFLADVDALVTAKIAEAADLLAAVNEATTPVQMKAALEALVEAGFTVGAGVTQADKVLDAMAEEGFTPFKSITAVIAEINKA